MRPHLFFRLLFVVVIVGVFASTLVAQITQRDVVYLKNGSVIKGAVLEQIPDKTVKIQTTDGSIFVFQMSEVERITKEGVAPPSADAQQAVAEPERRSGYFSFVAGGSLPVGAFASTEDLDAGLAMFGFVAGMEYANISSDGIYFAVGGSFIVNPVDEDAMMKMFGAFSGFSADIGSWKMIVPTISLGFGSTSSGARVFFAGDLGYAFSSTPDISVTYMGITSSEPSASAGGLAFGGRIGVQTAGGVTFMVRYLATKPTYERQSSGSTSPDEYEQKQEVVLFTLGIGL